MKKVLLAINGVTPSTKIFHYALQLCQRTTATLVVLQIIGKRHASGYFDKIRKKAGAVKQFFENSMIAATYAEAGEHDIALELIGLAKKNIQKMLQECRNAGVSYQLVFKKGEPEKEIINYVCQNRDVIFTIYDSPIIQQADKDQLKERKRQMSIMEKNLPTPLFVCNDEQEDELNVHSSIINKEPK
ncbi:UspA domain protein [Candidatus Magnetomorum sp. HK-1]|nr:UspA domain protein [Candidatus Magnetomorum sp. HK-1]